MYSAQHNKKSKKVIDPRLFEKVGDLNTRNLSKSIGWSSRILAIAKKFPVIMTSNNGN